MAATSKVKRVAGLSLAAAVAGSMTLVPAASAQESSTAQESAATVTESSTTTVAPSPTEPTVSATQSATVTTTPASGANNAGEVAAALRNLSDLAKEEEPARHGAGTSGVERTSGGWDFTALARNPQNDRLYAISKKKDTKGAGRLLRIAPQNGAVKDLGPIEIKDADATTIDTAAFTADGTLVLFDDTTIHTLDLSEDKPRSGTPDLKFVTKDLKIEDTKTAGTPAAWAPNAEAGEKTLVALSVNDKGEPFVWTLDVDAKDPVATHKAATAPADADLKDVEALNYAYSEGDEATFANDDVAITLQGENVTEVNTETTPEANVEAVAGTGDKESTGTPKSESDKPSADAEKPEKDKAADDKKDAAAKNDDASYTAELKVLVRTEDNKAVQGVEFETPSGLVEGVTGADGTADVFVDLERNAQLFKLQVKEAPKGYKTKEITVRRDAETAENLRQVGGLRVDAQTGLGHPAHARDGALAARAVLEGDRQRLADGRLLDGPPRDETLRLEDLRDVRLELGVRHGDLVVVRRVGVPDAGQHVRDRVGHGHVCCFFLTWFPLRPVTGPWDLWR